MVSSDDIDIVPISILFVFLLSLTAIVSNCLGNESGISRGSINVLEQVKPCEKSEIKDIVINENEKIFKYKYSCSFNHWVKVP